MGVLEYIGSLGGITGILAFAIFLIYRQDKKVTEDRLVQVSREYNDTVREHNEVMLQFTQVITELTVWLKARNHNS